MSDWPGEWVSAAEMMAQQVEEKVDLPAGEKTGPALINDNGLLFITTDERSEEYLWMENVPSSMENHC